MSLNILIVEDCDLVRKMMLRTLNLAQIPLANVHQAANGREALDIVAANWVDLILADLNMPVMDGVEMIDRLNGDGLLKSIPVVVVSTEGSETRMQELRQKGVTAYVRKPFTPEDIRDVVWETLGCPDPENRSGLLGDTFCRVMERFALMIGEADEEAAKSAQTEGWSQAKLSFRGPMKGTLTAAAPEELLREIAANVLGMDPDDGEAAAAAPEALKELVNLVAGQMLTEVDAVAVHDLTAPVYGPMQPTDWDPEGGTLAWFRVEGYPVALALRIRHAAA